MIHSPRLFREVHTVDGRILYPFRCTCGVQDVAATVAEIWAAHPLPRSATRDERMQRAPLRIVKGASK